MHHYYLRRGRGNMSGDQEQILTSHLVNEPPGEPGLGELVAFSSAGFCSHRAVADPSLQPRGYRPRCWALGGVRVDLGGWAGRWPGPGLDGQLGTGKAQKDHPSGDGHHWPRVRVSPDYLFVLIEKLSV